MHASPASMRLSPKKGQRSRIATLERRNPLTRGTSVDDMTRTHILE
jgi:hypothetical protein